MKKLFVFIMFIIVIFSCLIAVSAEKAQYATAGELYQAWAEDLPDYICGVWSTDGGTSNLTFGVQNNEAGNAGKEKILELIENDSSVTFVYQEFSRNYLLQIQKEIDKEYLGKETGLISTGPYDINNCIMLGIKEDKKDDPDTQKMIEEITSKYGKAVSFEYTDKILLFTGDDNSPVDYNKFENTQLVALFTFLLFTLLFSGVIFAVVKRRKTAILQTNSGITVSHSQKKVENMVKESDYNVPSELDKKIINSISKY